MRAWAVVVAGGSGARFGGAKQFSVLGGRRVVDWAVGAARAACEGVVLVLPAEQVARVALDVQPDAVVAGGATRSASVRAGLAQVPAGVEAVIVHDAARPFAHPGLFVAVLEALGGGADGAVVAVPVADTLKRVGGDGTVQETVDRAGLWAVQTPQAFRLDVLRAAHAGEPEATDDAGLVEAAGGRVVVVAGDRRNLKVTDPADLAILEALVGR
ncbi:MAG: 2-C-methyl-D-erythritol 4-phosphate cytidylyltransferase [Acidimicrobiales bacterium]